MVDLKPPPVLLSFSATLVSNQKEDNFRDFVVTYYYYDRAFSVTERTVPNSGFKGGKFLQKKVIINPETNLTYEPKDIYIGAIIKIDGWIFQLQEASEHTLKIMEALSDEFIRSDIQKTFILMKNIVKGKVSEILVEFQKLDHFRNEWVTALEFQSVLRNFGVILADQEFLTVFRRFHYPGTDHFDYPEFCKHLA